MAAGPYDTYDVRVRVSTTSGGTYTSVALVRSSDLTEGSDGSSKTKYFGGEVVKAGDPNLSLRMSVLFDAADTLGQAILRTAKRAGTSVWIQWCYEGTATGDKVEQAEYKVDEIALGANADSDWVEGTLALTGVPSTLTTVTLA